MGFHWLEDLIRSYGVVTIFLVATLEGDVVILLGGVIARLGGLHATHAALAAAAGMWTGDAGWYVLGRLRAREFRETWFYRRVGPTVERFVGMLGPWQILTARFVYGTRYASMVFWGLQRLPATTFLGINALGCLAWAGLLVNLGFLMSQSVELVLDRIRRTELWIAGSLALTALVYFGAMRLLKRVTPPPPPSPPAP